MNRITVCAFRGPATFPLAMARDLGLFADHGLEVELVWTASAEQLITGLLDGTYPIVQASPDNIVAARDRTGQAIVAWYAGSSGPISLVVRPEVADLADLRDQDIAVDHPDTGWAPILLRILAGAGIGRDEVRQVGRGATAVVYADLVEGRTPAAMLNEPWATRATVRGCRRIADHRTVAPELLTSAGASHRAWLRDEAEVASAYLGAVVAATAWILDPSVRTEAVDRLEGHLGATRDEAAAVFDVLSLPAGGWPRSPMPSQAGIRAVCELRSSVGRDPRFEPETYLDEVIARRVADPPSGSISRVRGRPGG